MLITHEDLQSTLNIELTDPNGQEAADALIAAAQGLFSSNLYLGFPIESSSVTEYRSDGYSLIYLNTKAPVSSLVAALHNHSTGTYDAIDTSLVTNHGTREVQIHRTLPDTLHSLRLTYTTGWTAETLPADLKQALIETVGLKLQGVANFSAQPPGSEEEEGGESSSTGGLKKVSAGSYTEEYSTAEADAYWKAHVPQLTRSIGEDIPEPTKELLYSYRPNFAL